MMARRLRANRPADGGGGLLPLPPVSDGLVGWWPCNDGSGLIVRDHSGNGNDGVLFGDPLPTWVTEDGEECLYSVEGAGATIPFDAATISNLADVSFTGWVNTTQVTLAFFCEDYNDGGDATRVRLDAWNNAGRAVRGASVAINGGHSITNGTWYRTAGWFMNNTSRYDGACSINGTYNDGPTFGVATPDTAYGWTIGDTKAIAPACGNCAKPFTGFVKDLRIYNRLLTEQEMKDITNGIG